MNKQYLETTSFIIFFCFVLSIRCFGQCKCGDIQERIAQKELENKVKPKVPDNKAKSKVPDNKVESKVPDNTNQDNNFIRLQNVNESSGIDTLLNQYLELLNAPTWKISKNIKLIECLNLEIPTKAIADCDSVSYILYSKNSVSYILYSKKHIQSLKPLTLEFALVHEISHHMRSHIDESIPIKNTKNIDPVHWKNEFFADAEAIWLISKQRGKWLSKEEIDIIFSNIKEVLQNNQPNWSHPPFDDRSNHAQIQLLGFKKNDTVPGERDNPLKDRIDSTRDLFIDEKEFFLSNEQKEQRAEERRKAKSERKNKQAIANYNSALETLKTTINQNLIDTLKHTKDSLDRDPTTIKKLNYLINKLEWAYDTKPNYLTVEPFLGFELLSGTIKKNEQKLNPRFFPLYKIGFRFSQIKWETKREKWFYPWSIDIAANHTKIDIYQSIQGGNRTVESVSMNFVQATPRIGIGYRFRNSVKNSLKNSTKSNFVTLSLGVPANLGKYKYENFLTPQQNNIKWDTDFFKLENLAYQVSYNHVSRISGNDLKKKYFSSYSISFQYYRPGFTIKITQPDQYYNDKIISKIGFYEVKLAYRCWR